MNTIFITILIILSIAFLFAVYFLYRNEKVFVFRMFLIKLVHEGLDSYLKSINYNLELEELIELQNKSKNITSKYNYDQMLYSFKKLKAAKWFNSDELSFLHLCMQHYPKQSK